MSQYPGNFPNQPYGGQPYDQFAFEPRKTSGLAITALVCSLIFCCPITTVLAVILGAIAMVTIGPERKGRGMALTAIILGIVFTIAQGIGGYWFYNTFYRPVLEGPREALAKGFAGDIAGFKAEFHGTGATLPDQAATEFINELRNRYGEFQTLTFDYQSGQSARTQPGQPEAPFPYVITFGNKTVKATAVMVFADPNTGGMVFRFGSITVHDKDLGDLTYPPEGAGATSTSPTSPATAPAGGGPDGG